MQSQWYELKPKAISLREKGLSIREIEIRLKIPRSTLSGWFKNVKLSTSQKLKLRGKWINGMVLARKKAVVWHNQQKKERLRLAEKEAETLLSEIDTPNNSLVELSLAMLYLGEGLKTKAGTSMGNSDPIILKFFIKVMTQNFNIELSHIKCGLHLRADQDSVKLKRYWSKELEIPLKNFTYVIFDKRTHGSPTYPRYNGVCVLRCGNVKIQRKLVFIAKKFCHKIINTRAISSVG